MSISKLNISKNLGIGCLLCCVSKIAIFAFGGSALLGGGAIALNPGLLQGIMLSAGFGLICLAFHKIQSREKQLKTCPVIKA